MAITVKPGKYPHVYFIDINDDGTVVECAVMRQDPQGNIYYIRLDSLDSIDAQRLLKVLQSRNVETMELWDAMANVTLGNGVNCLEYFHQLTKVLTPSGVVMKPTQGQYGVALVDESPSSVPTADEAAQAEEIVEAAKEAGVKAKRKGRPGRPKKV